MGAPLYDLDSGGQRVATAQLYDGPIVRRLKSVNTRFSPGHPVIIDRYGVMMIEPSDFLRSKRRLDNSPGSADHWARILSDFLFVLQNAGGGNGLGWWNTDDALLERLRSYMTGDKYHQARATGNRGITSKTWNERLTLILEFLLHCEKKGWVRGLIGLREGERHYRVNLERITPTVRHYLHLPIIKSDEVVIPADEAFTLVEAACERGRKSSNLHKRDRLIFRMLDRGLRRSEVVNLLCSNVPTASQLARRRERAKASGVLKPVPMTVIGAKKSGVRVVLLPLKLAELLREYIDDVRPLLKPNPNEDAIFTAATRRRERLSAQTLTNALRTARSLAVQDGRASGLSDEEIDEILAVHPHIYRHRFVTESLADGIEGGLEPLHVMIDTMKSTGIKSVSTISIYSHLAESRRRSVMEKKQAIHKVDDDRIAKRWDSLRSAELILKAKFDRSKARHGS